MLPLTTWGEPETMYAYPAGGPSGNDAFTALCEEYRARLVAYCRRRLRGSVDAEDAAHEALLRAHRAFAAFDSSSDPWPWLRTIAGRVCTDILRRASRPTPPLGDDHAGVDVHEQVAVRLRAEIVDDALGRLPSRFRTPLLLREYGGWSYEDIARVEGKSLSSVRSILSRSKRRLGTHVESVARARNQWPLPGALPPVRRLREQLRSWRDAIERSGHGFLGALELSTAATRWMAGASASVATVLAGSTVVIASVVAPAAPAPAASPAVTVPAAAETTAPDHPTEVTVGVAAAPVRATASVRFDSPAKKTLTAIDTTSPQPNGMDLGIESTGTVSISSSGRHVFITHDTTRRDGNGTSDVILACTPTVAQQIMCRAVEEGASRFPAS